MSAPREFDQALMQCEDCGTMKSCTYVKHAHVPLYGWVCGRCRTERKPE